MFSSVIAIRAVTRARRRFCFSVTRRSVAGAVRGGGLPRRAATRDAAVVAEIQASQLDRLVQGNVQPGPIYTDLPSAGMAR